MVEYQYAMVLETRQPLLRVKLNFDSRKYPEKRTTTHSLIGRSVLRNNNKLASRNATIQNTAKRISAYAETDPGN